MLTKIISDPWSDSGRLYIKKFPTAVLISKLFKHVRFNSYSNVTLQAHFWKWHLFLFLNIYSFLLEKLNSKHFFEKFTRKNRAEQWRPLWLTLRSVTFDVIITSEPTDFYWVECVLGQKEIFINLQPKVVWKPGAIYDFLLRWACVQFNHITGESTTRSSRSL